MRHCAQTIWPFAHPIAAAMGDVVESQASVAPIFIVTGFSSFSGVAANPTEDLIRYLESSQPKSAGAEHRTPNLVSKGHVRGSRLSIGLCDG